ncbi:MAG: carbohydrate ABC transporter permease [Acutalibacteraceae bacterium]
MAQKTSGKIAPHKKSLLARIWQARIAYLLLAPLLIGLIVTAYYPPISGLYHSLFDWNANGREVFIGLDNFKELFQDPVFLNSIPTLFKLMIPRLLISVIVPLIAAELIFGVRSKRWQYNYRVMVLLPMVAPGLVYTLLWQKIYDPQSGLLSTILRGLGLIGQDQIVNWLGDPKLVIPALIFMGFPWIGGTAVLIYMSGLMNISGEVIEASILDGCTPMQRIRHIDLPLLIGQIKYFLVFGLIGGIQDYNSQLVLTQGGPGYTTYVPGYYMYIKAFGASRMGYASAVGVVMFVVIFGLTILIMRYKKKEEV